MCVWKRVYVHVYIHVFRRKSQVFYFMAPFYLFLLFCLPYVYGYWSVCLVPQKARRRCQDSPRLELQKVMRCDVSTGTWTYVLWKNSHWLLTAELSLWLALIYFQTGVWNLSVTNLASHLSLGIYLMLHSLLPTCLGLVYHYSWPIPISQFRSSHRVVDGSST